MENDKRKLISQKIGKKIYNIRQENHLTREKFAELCDISSQQVYFLEKGDFLPGCATIIDICNQFNVSPSSLLLDALEPNSRVLEESIISDFDKLSKNEKTFIINTVNYMINQFTNKDST